MPTAAVVAVVRNVDRAAAGAWRAARWGAIVAVAATAHTATTHAATGPPPTPPATGTAASASAAAVTATIGAQPAPAASAAASASPPLAAEPAPPSGPGQRIYERVRPLLLQVRTLLKTQDSQSSVGSGFVVAASGLLITNYHVVSQYALQPARHRLVYATADGRSGALELLAFDVVNDLALLRPADAGPLAGRGAVPLRPADQPLAHGTRIYALGNPLDVGFAVAEGTYNGPVERSFLATLFFGGSLSAGMSGGPALDDQGRLVGVNVAARRDGEQISFLVPVDPVRRLLARAAAGAPLTAPAWPEVTRQLLDYQADLTARFVAQPWRDAGHARYTIPVPQETWLRCWGRGSPQATRGLRFERSDCEMDTRLFVSGSLSTGYVTVRHEAYDGQRIGALRFAQRYSQSFGNEFVGHDERHRTAAQCVERSVQAGALDGGAAGRPLPLRAVACLRAYKKLPGLYDLTVLVATLDGDVSGAQGRFDARGVSLASAQTLTRHYLDGYGWTAPKNASH